MIRRFDFSAALKVLLVGVVAGASSFMFMPMILSGLIGAFTASVTGVVIAMPLIFYFLDFPSRSIDFQNYYPERGLFGIILDLLMTLLAGLAPAVVLLYLQLSLGFLPPVPVASSAAVGVFVGYSAFLFRNRDFFEDNSKNIVL